MKLIIKRDEENQEKKKQNKYREQLQSCQVLIGDSLIYGHVYTLQKKISLAAFYMSHIVFTKLTWKKAKLMFYYDLLKMYFYVNLQHKR